MSCRPPPSRTPRALAWPPTCSRGAGSCAGDVAKPFMKLLVALDYTFMRTPDGAVWSLVGMAYSFWLRYLEVFDFVRVVARVVDVPVAPPTWLRSDGMYVTFSAVPAYRGPLQYALRRSAVRRAVDESFTPGDAVILRLGSVLADALLPRLRKAGHPYAVEVV